MNEEQGRVECAEASKISETHFRTDAKTPRMT